MPLTNDDARARLPASVYDLALRLGVNPDTRRSGVRLTQTGRIRRSLASDAWMAFTAVQTISALDCAFEWKARAGVFGLVTAVDAIADDQPRFDVMVMGLIPMVRAPKTAALLRGERMRYLAVLPMAPDAILRNTALRWCEDGPDALWVGAGSGDGAAEVQLLIGSDGTVAGAFAPDRPRSDGAAFLPTPWHCRLSDYRQTDGILLPWQGEVAWEIDGAEVPYWQGRMSAWRTA